MRKITVAKIKRKIVEIKYGKYMANIYHTYILTKKYQKQFDKVISNFVSKEKMEKSNKIWILWLQGEENAPALVKACIKSVRDSFSNRNYEIIILSENNLSQYVTFPNYIDEKFKKGIISFAHYSDLIRLYLLTKYGGYWFDATCYVTGTDYFNFIEEQDMFVFKVVTLNGGEDFFHASSSWFIYSKTNAPILLLTLELLYEYWKRYNFSENYYLIHILFKIATKKFSKEWEAIPVFDNISPHIMQFELLKEWSMYNWSRYLILSDIHKLNWRISNSDKRIYTNYDYIINKVNGEILE